ncbi:cell division septation protein DedD [Thiogranum longum]|uniref:Cell division septation protein DedD n=1 Tax=Thiogranum longum TaxID=1537524 RepID=A0A4R1HCR7_9GAMM|nr:hypothetical protein [Thiogranum longum]TCK19248.1 cell division septation protein DedD [Thiogranum longum]
MKNLVYLLLGLNLAFFAWLQFQPAPSPPELRLKPLPPGAVPLVQLSERKQSGGSDPTLVAGEGAETGTAPVPAVSQSDDSKEQEDIAERSPVCRTIGPLKSSDEAAALRTRLSEQGIPAALRQSETQAPSGYQVYLQAASSRKAAEIVRSLEAAGMTDYFVGKRNRISLGIFSSKSKAQIRLSRVRELGHDARLDVRYKTRKVYWIDIEEKEQLLEDFQGWEQVKARYPRLKVQQVSCE